MRELNQTELMSIQGAVAGNHSDLEVIGLTSAAASVAGAVGYFISYQTFSVTEGLLFMSAGSLPTVIATGMILGGLQAYHHLKK